MKYYQQLEALWTLINLATSEDRNNLMRILACDLTDLNTLMDKMPDELEEELTLGDSQILRVIDQLISEKVNNAGVAVDMKALNLIIEFLKNIVYSGPLFAQKIASKTRIFDAIKYMLQSSPLFHSEVI